MGKLLVILAILGVAYWYWSGPSHKSTEQLEADRLQANAETMRRCVNQERRMETAGGLAGVAEVGGSGADAERLCAAKYHLQLRDGNWHDRPD